MNETKTIGDIIRDQEYAAAREFIRRKYPITELGATALMEFSLERNEYFRKIAEQAQQIVTAVINTTVMPPLIVQNFPRTSQNQTVSSGVEGAHEGTTADEKGESREPEKLNNAQPGCTYSTFSSATCARGSNGCDVRHNALAESSLSQNECKTAGHVSQICSRGTATCYVRHPESSLSSPPPLEMPHRESSSNNDKHPCPACGNHMSLCSVPKTAWRCLFCAASPELLPTQLPKEK